MKKINTLIICMLFSLLVAASAAYCLDVGREPVGEFGYIDWIDMKVTATGIGAPSDHAVNAAQARAMAKRAAIVVARRNLLEVVKGVYIDSQTRVENFMLQNDRIVTRVKGILKGSTIDEITYQPDGSCLARVSMPLTGELGETLLKLGNPGNEGQASAFLLSRLDNLEKRVEMLENKILLLKKINLQQKQLSELFVQLIDHLTTYQKSFQLAGLTSSDQVANLELALQHQAKKQASFEKELKKMAERLSRLESKFLENQNPASKSAKNIVPYTSLIVDAKGLNFRPCLKPKLFNKGRLLYPGDYIDFNLAVRKGYVRYYRHLSQAQRSKRAGNLPYTIKAAKVYRNRRGSLLLNSSDAKYLKKILSAENNFLKECKVIIVF
ncbi:LPP20 family lipoprotein [Desulfovulcanus sp.]